MADLDPRKKTILQAIIVEYVEAAEPIGSEMLVQKYGLGVKSATVRNEMAEMSEMGYLEQPHTSAGRIPSDLGYRFYVDRLIDTREPSEATRQQVKDASGEGDALQMMLRDTTRALSRITHLLTVATTVRDGGVIVRSAIVSALGPTQALLVLALSNGQIENRFVECPVGLTLQDVGLANEHLVQSLVGKPLRSLTKAKAPTIPENITADKLLQTLWGHVRTMAKDLTRGTLVTEGEEFMFAQPEFSRDAGTLAELLNDLVESDVLFEAVSTPEPVTIGRENRHERMKQLSVVRQSFYVGENEAGVIALVGPTRMKYETSIPLVSFTAKALSDSLTRFFG